MVDLVDGPIPIDRLLSDSADESCGATVLFLGTTRRWTSNSETGQTETAYLEYEGYREMALVKLAELEAIARERVELKSKSPALQCSSAHLIAMKRLKPANGSSMN